MKKLTHEEFLNKVYSKHNNRITILDEYKNNLGRVNVKCNVCNNIWETSAKSIINGSGCPECGKIKSRNTIKHHITTEDFKNKIDVEFLKKIEILGDYVGLKERISVKCKLCDNIWEPKAYYLIKKQGCDICFRKDKGVKARKSHSEFEQEVEIYHNKTISLVSQYITGKSPIKYICNLCLFEDEKPIARSLLNRGCVNCCFSKGEKKIKTILCENKINFKPQYSFDDLININKLVFDFGIFGDNNELTHLIEFDGEQHYRPIKHFGGKERFEIQKINDELKNKYCFDNNIRLIRIPYWEYKNLKIESLL